MGDALANPAAAKDAAPPVPTRNPAFSDPVGDATGKAILDKEPLARKALEALFPKSDKGVQTKPGAPEGMAGPNMFGPQQGPAGSFNANPWTRETIQGTLVGQIPAKDTPVGGGAAPSPLTTRQGQGADTAAKGIRFDLERMAKEQGRLGTGKAQDRLGPLQAATDTAKPLDNADVPPPSVSPWTRATALPRPWSTAWSCWPVKPSC